jgi:hypothetical protein
MKIIFYALLFVAVASSKSFGQTNIVAPNNLANLEGDTGGGLGFWSIDTPQSVRIQQVFDASQFSAISHGGWIEGFSIRASSEGHDGGDFGATLPQFQINFSTTTRGPDSLSPNFAENIGADEMVASGPGRLHVSAGGYLTSIQPQAFGGTVFFQTPFFYNPAAGNLLMDIRNWETAVVPFLSPRRPLIDGEFTRGDSISMVFRQDVFATEGIPDTFGYVVQFRITPVPEPSSLCLLAICSLACGVRWVYRGVHRANSTRNSPPGSKTQSSRPFCSGPEFMRVDFLALVLVAAAASALGGQTTVVTPNNLANTEGNSAGAFPFWSLVTPESVRFQQVFDASQFSAIDQGGWIERISIRSSSEGREGSSFHATLSQVQINFSTTPREPDNLSPVFADNIGADEAIAYGPGSLRIDTCYDRTQQPQLFGSIYLQQPFFYAPAQGNLLLDIRNWQTAAVPFHFPQRPFIDAEWVQGDSVSSVLSRNVLATEGSLDTFGFVFQFVITPIPEPSSFCLLAICSLACGARWVLSRRAKRAQANQREPNLTERRAHPCP